MTTQEVADKLVEYCNQGAWDKAHAELYSPDCTSTEPEGAPNPGTVKGMDAIAKKGEAWQGMVEEFHGAEIEGPLVAGDFFSLVMKMDITMKGRPRMVDEEVCMYKVKDGKIVSESFFY